MVYAELDVDREDIRLLRLNDGFRSDTLSNPLHLTLEVLSLDAFSEDFVNNTSHSQPNQNWNDAFSFQIEYRRAMLDLRHSTPQHTLLQKETSTRFSWGDYEALSYTWGDEEHRMHIKLNGVLTEVSRNLEAALRMLHALPETQAGMKYWIDALCINQKDVKERNVQVKRMKKIYGTARSVVVWLGPMLPSDEIALRTIRSIYRDKEGQLIRPRDFDANHWEALCAFIKKSYWSRLWIIQELAANQNSTLFVCGEEELTRDDLRLAAKCCQKLQREEVPFACEDAAIWEISTRLIRLIDLNPNIGEDKVLQKALSLSRQAAVSKEKDKVYGIMALLAESVSSAINPDYGDTTSIQDVYTVLTVAILKETGRLEQIVYGSTDDLEWPSWVPDLRLPFRRQHMKYLQEFRASGQTRAEVSFSEHSFSKNMYLRVKGIEVDYIDGASTTSALDDIVLPRHYNIRYKFSSAKAVGKTLVAGHPKIRKGPVFMKLPWKLQHQSEESSIWNSQEYLDFDKFRQINQSLTVNGRTLKSLFPEHSRRRPDYGLDRYHLRVAGIACKGRKLVTTKSGYLELVPECVQREDVLVVLLGCNFPVLLRPYKEGYRVLGECYIHGLMMGEVFDAQKEECLLTRVFTLL